MDDDGEEEEEHLTEEPEGVVPLSSITVSFVRKSYRDNALTIVTSLPSLGSVI